jgi:hypothetical protein
MTWGVLIASEWDLLNLLPVAKSWFLEGVPCLTCPGNREGLVLLHRNWSLQQTSTLEGDERGFVDKVS